MRYTYRLYNALTGHEYADVDSMYTARILQAAFALTAGVDGNEITVEMLIDEEI